MVFRQPVPECVPIPLSLRSHSAHAAGFCWAGQRSGTKATPRAPWRVSSGLVSSHSPRAGPRRDLPESRVREAVPRMALESSSECLPLDWRGCPARSVPARCVSRAPLCRSAPWQLHPGLLKTQARAWLLILLVFISTIHLPCSPAQVQALWQPGAPWVPLGGPRTQIAGATPCPEALSFTLWACSLPVATGGPRGFCRV